MKALTILLLMVSLYACKKNNVAVFDSTAFDISYFDQNGNDLLDPNNPKSYKESDIDIYYLLDGIKVKQYQGNLEFPEFFWIPNEIRFETTFDNGTIKRGKYTFPKIAALPTNVFEVFVIQEAK